MIANPHPRSAFAVLQGQHPLGKIEIHPTGPQQLLDTLAAQQQIEAKKRGRHGGEFIQRAPEQV
jgi:hypothetical protein